MINRYGTGTQRAVAATVMFVALLTASGCQTDGSGPISRWRMAFDNGMSRPPTVDEAGGSGGLLSRWLNKAAPKSSEETAPGLVLGSNGWSPMKPPVDPVADGAYHDAEVLFQQGKLDEAEKAFAKLAKKYKGKHWGEKAQFQIAEIDYQQGHLRRAHDSYERLIADYPGTQFLDKAVGREYAIAQVWLAALDPKAKPEQKASLQERWDGKYPVLDTSGFTLSVLEHVRHHDPTGPLADVATMKIADYHYMHKNWEEATIYYDQLITDYPKSKLVRQALLSSIDAKMKGYLGPDYDGVGLEKAKAQIDQFRKLYPERTVSTEDSLDHVLVVIDQQMAERAYRTAEHYLWTGKVSAAEYAFAEIPLKWPKSEYASKAKEQLTKIATMPRKESKPSKMMTLPGSTDSIPGGAMGMGSMGGMGGMNGMGMGGMGMGGMGGMG